MEEKDRITKQLKRTFEKGAWHGPALCEILEGITQEDATKRLPNTHSIIELVTHMTSWRIYTAKRLQGDGSYEVTDEMNFPSTTDWSKALRELNKSQEGLLSALEKFPAENLSALVPHPKSKFTFYTLLHGIIQHDIYHAGQIALIRKAYSAQSV